MTTPLPGDHPTVVSISRSDGNPRPQDYGRLLPRNVHQDIKIFLRVIGEETRPA